MERWRSSTVRAVLSATMLRELRSMNQHRLRKPVGPAVASLARRTAALKDAARRLWRWPREAASPSLTATIRLARLSSGRDGKTALQPNQKTGSMSLGRRTTHALQTADIFTWQRQLPNGFTPLVGIPATPK